MNKTPNLSLTKNQEYRIPLFTPPTQIISGLIILESDSNESVAIKIPLPLERMGKLSKIAICK